MNILITTKPWNAKVMKVCHFCNFCNLSFAYNKYYMVTYIHCRLLNVHCNHLLAGTTLTMPRIAGRQNNRNNVPAHTPEEYYRRAIFFPFLDGILTQITLRFCNHEAAVLRLCGLLPKFAPNVSFRDIEEGVVHYSALLSRPVEAVELEFQTWQILCRGMDNPPYDCMSALDLCDKTFYPAIHSLLSIFATLPVSTATAERTFSVLKYLKSYLRSTTGEERLTGLALAYIHRDIDVDETVDLVVDLFGTKQRKIIL